MGSAAGETNRCKCLSTAHGHKAGGCTKEALIDREGFCDECYQHELSARAGAFQPLFDPLHVQRRNMDFLQNPIMETWWPTQSGMPAILQRPPALPETDPFYALVGRVASEWAHLEHILDTTIWGLLGVTDVLAACVTSQIMGVPGRCKAVMTLSAAQGLDEAIWGKPFRQLMSSSYDTSDWRNRYVHDFWVIPEPGKATQFRAMPYKDQRFGLVEVSKADIDRTLEKIRALQKQASDLRSAVLEAFAASSKKTP
jgi:hypothetical protein